MQILLLEDQTLLRQLIGMSRPPIADNAEISAYGSYETLYASERHLHRFDTAIIDPGVPPVRPPFTAEARTQRLDYGLQLKSRLSKTCKVIILTGAPDDTERLQFLRAGVHAYIAKNTVDIVKLRQIIMSFPETADRERPALERYDTQLTTAEAIGHAVGQKLYRAADIATSLQVDQDTVLKYVQRARKRQVQRIRAL